MHLILAIEPSSKIAGIKFPGRGFKLPLTAPNCS